LGVKIWEKGGGGGISQNTTSLVEKLKNIKVAIQNQSFIARNTCHLTERKSVMAVILRSAAVTCMQVINARNAFM